MQEYNLQWEYIPGSKNVVADVLSRVDLQNQTFEGEKESILKIYNIIRDRSDLEKVVRNISIHQQSDPKLSSIQRRLADQDDTITKFYCIHNNVLFIKPSLDEEIWKIIIPTNIEKEIIMDYHIRYGHMGAMKVVKALEENCHIKDINRKVRRYIKNCFICQLVKTNNDKKEGVMIPITSQKKLEKIFLDICGPFPRSGGRHQYKYIIIMMDHFTKFIKLYPVNRATTLKVLGVCLLYTSRCV